MEQAPAHDPLIGAQIGNYQIRSKLGEGGMGAVYLAEHPRIGKKVALKILHAEFSANQDITQRFFNEARAVNDIGHPNIVDIIDYGVIPGAGAGMVYFIMELLQGRALAQVIRDEAPLAPERALSICLQIADALAASHRHRIVHRDLKPDNIILLERGVQRDFVKVLDFGIAKLTGDQPGSRRTRTGIVMGTPAYMSPEQCEGRGLVDHRTDVYALGIVLYEMLTGRVPFLGEGYGEILVQHLTAIPQRPSTFRGVIPPHVEAVCMKALEKKPDQRYPNMDELILALRDPVGYVEARGGIGGFVTANLGAPSINPTPLPSHIPLATPAPGAYGTSPPTGAPSTSAHPAQSPSMLTPAPYMPTPAPVAPRRSRGGLYAVIGVVAVAAIAGGVLATRGGDKPAAAAAGAGAAAAPATATIRVTSTPPGADLYNGDILVGTTPTSFTVARGDAPVEIALRASGFAERRERIVPSQDRDLTLRLEALPEPATAAAATPSSATATPATAATTTPAATATEPAATAPASTAASTDRSRTDRTRSDRSRTDRTRTGDKPRTGDKATDKPKDRTRSKQVGNNTLEPEF